MQIRQDGKSIRSVFVFDLPQHEVGCDTGVVEWRPDL